MSAIGMPRTPGTSTKMPSVAILEKASEPGQISYTCSSQIKQTINYFAGDSESVFQVGDKVCYLLFGF